jgi:hypothetical protein
MIPNLDRLVSWVDQLSLDWDIFGWVVIEMIGVFSSDLVGWDRSILWVDRFGDCGDLPTRTINVLPCRAPLPRGDFHEGLIETLKPMIVLTE